MEKRKIVKSCREAAANRFEATRPSSVSLFIGSYLFPSSILSPPDDFIHGFCKSYFNFYKSHQEFFIIIHLHTHLGRKNKPKVPKNFQTRLWLVKPAESRSKVLNSQDRRCTETIALTLGPSLRNFTRNCAWKISHCTHLFAQDFNLTLRELLALVQLLNPLVEVLEGRFVFHPFDSAIIYY